MQMDYIGFVTFPVVLISLAVTIAGIGLIQKRSFAGKLLIGLGCGLLIALVFYLLSLL
jgi:VIT1/CCC1 family predicted Fe2+/Mn2+ transporter